jgi:hypothetical protein
VTLPAQLHHLDGLLDLLAEFVASEILAEIEANNEGMPKRGIAPEVASDDPHKPT